MTYQDPAPKADFGSLFGGISNFVMSNLATASVAPTQQPDKKKFDFDDPKDEDDVEGQVMNHLVQENRTLKHTLN